MSSFQPEVFGHWKAQKGALNDWLQRPLLSTQTAPAWPAAAQSASVLQPALPMTTPLPVQNGSPARETTHPQSTPLFIPQTTLGAASTHAFWPAQVQTNWSSTNGHATHCLSRQVCVPEQLAHCAAPAPQAWTVTPGSQAPGFPGPLAQHPLGQLAWVQTQRPPTQVVPVVHTAQNPPSVPHAWSVEPAWQVPVSSQQPLEQTTPAQTQRPLTHGVPGGQTAQAFPPPPQAWGDVPATQVLVVRSQQPSCGHCTHATPPTPQKTGGKGGEIQVGGSPKAVVQQPWGQEAALQTHRPSTHSRPTPQSVPQVPPQNPVVPCRHTPVPSQQPLGQLAAVQLARHWPVSSSQSSPAGQAPHVPSPPQPLGPHCLPAQLGAQHNPSGLHSVAPGSQHSPSQQCPEDSLPHSPLGSGPSATAV